MAMSFCQKIQRIMRTKLVFIPGKVRIGIEAGVFPVVVSWSLKHQRPLGMLYRWSACFELAWIFPTKSTCSQLKRKLEIEVKAITVCCLWSGSLIWCIVMMFEWLKHSLIKPSFEFACYGSLEVWEKWKSANWFSLVLGLILMFKPVLYWLWDVLDTKFHHCFCSNSKMLCFSILH